MPVLQAGMGGGVADAALAGAVAAAGGLGTIGMLPPERLRSAISRVRDEAPGRSVAVNVLVPFARRAHVRTCLEARADIVVLAFGGNAALVRQLRAAGIFVMVMVGTETQARAAVAWGADALIAQGRESGGHLMGSVAALDFLPRARAIAGDRPVFLAGGIATAADTRTALAAGAAGVLAGTRFLLTEESGAHREYQRRVLAARETVETTLFGLGWPARHRVVPNAATLRWCAPDGTARRGVRAFNTVSGVFGRWAPAGAEATLLRMQRPGWPWFGPAAPLVGMPDSWSDRAALYAGESALRITEVVSAKRAVAELAGS